MATDAATVAVGAYELTLTGGEGPFRGSLSTEQTQDGVDLVHICIEADEPSSPPVYTLSWRQPVVDIAGYWHPGAGHDKGLSVSWGPGALSKATSNAPVGCAHSSTGRNRLTFALSDALNAVTLKAGVSEETATLDCAIGLFDPSARQRFGPPAPPQQTPPAASTPMTRYEATLRLDTRDVPYHEALREVGAWWATLPGYEPAPVPEVARLPMYSTWYSFHQALTPEGIEEQCRLSKALGCEAVIVDDGWQTTSNERGYAYTGDWQPALEKMPYMRAHVDRVHALGLQYILWYSVPFVGVHSQAYGRFQDKFLGENARLETAILDPRFPEVREYLIGTYETAMREWDLDGFKLDFVDAFEPTPDRQGERGGGRDIDSVPEAADRLLTDVIARLRAIKPDVMVEFRQSYIGPLMRNYGNMFRAGDCPNDAVENRVRTLDIRLLCGDTAAHADMLMWHPEESAESAALQLLNVLFSVPQISVLLDRVPPKHIEMLRFWLGFWREHRDVLLDGQLAPLAPEAMYPVVLASTPEKQVAAVYADAVVSLQESIPSQLMIVNGTLGDRVVIELAADCGTRALDVRDCRGVVVRTESVHLAPGLHRIEIPSAGLATLRAQG